MLLINKVNSFFKDETGEMITTTVITVALVGISLYYIGTLLAPSLYTERVKHGDDRLIQPELIARDPKELVKEVVETGKTAVDIIVPNVPGTSQYFEGTSQEVKFTDSKGTTEVSATKSIVPGSGTPITILKKPQVFQDNQVNTKTEHLVILMLTPSSTILKVAQESPLRRITDSEVKKPDLRSDMINAVANTHKNWSSDSGKTVSDYWADSQKIIDNRNIKSAAAIETEVKRGLDKQKQLASDELMETRRMLNVMRRDIVEWQNEINAFKELEEKGYILGTEARRDLENRQRWVADVQGLVAKLEVKEKDLATQVAASTSVTIEGNREIFIDLTGDTQEFTHLFTASAKPDGAYRFEWQFGDGHTASDNLKPGEKSSEIHTYTGLIAGGTLKPVVNLYDDAGNLLGSDTITINIRGAEFALRINAPQVLIDGGGVIETNYTFEAVGTIPDMAAYKWRINGLDVGDFDRTLTSSFNSVGDYTFECSASWNQKAADGSSYEERVAAEPIVVSIKEAREDVDIRTGDPDPGGSKVDPPAPDPGGITSQWTGSYTVEVDNLANMQGLKAVSLKLIFKGIGGGGLFVGASVPINFTITGSGANGYTIEGLENISFSKVDDNQIEWGNESWSQDKEISSIWKGKKVGNQFIGDWKIEHKTHGLLFSGRWQADLK